MGATILTGCLSQQDRNTDSSFATVTRFGSIFDGMEAEASQALIDVEGDGFVFSYGSPSEGGLKAASGYVVSSDIGSGPLFGVAHYNGQYFLVEMTDIELNGNFISGQPAYAGGAITLIANFSTGQISGSAGNLSVNGIASGNSISGSVTCKGLAGSLQGEIGQEKAIGAFHGNDADLIFAGGFLTYD